MWCIRPHHSNIIVFRKALFLSESLHMPYSGGYFHLQIRKQNHRQVNYISEVTHGGPGADLGKKVLTPSHSDLSKIQLKQCGRKKFTQKDEEEDLF